MTNDGLNELRNAIDDIKWRWAFGERHVESPLKTSLLWHFGYSRLLAAAQGAQVRARTDSAAAPVSQCRGSAGRPFVVLQLRARHARRRGHAQRLDHVLLEFALRGHQHGRHDVQFVGDEVLALFGVPDVQDGYVQRALECARSLLQIGSSVSNRWQREIDRIQPSGGVHIGMAMGDIQSVLYRPFCRSHVGIVGDAVNLAARLLGAGGDQRDRRVQHLFPDPARPRPARVPGNGAARGQERRPHQGVEARAAVELLDTRGVSAAEGIGERGFAATSQSRRKRCDRRRFRRDRSSCRRLWHELRARCRHCYTANVRPNPDSRSC